MALSPLYENVGSGQLSCAGRMLPVTASLYSSVYPKDNFNLFKKTIIMIDQAHIKKNVFGNLEMYFILLVQRELGGEG